VKGSFRELLSKYCGYTLYALESPTNKPDVVVTVADCACVQEVTTEAKRCVSWPRGGGADDVRRKLPGCLSKGQLSPTSDRPTRPQVVRPSSIDRTGRWPRLSRSNSTDPVERAIVIRTIASRLTAGRRRTGQNLEDARWKSGGRTQLRGAQPCGRCPPQ